MNPDRRRGINYFGLVVLLGTAQVCLGGDRRPSAPVPPTLEIEVLDPGVDPVGNPAVIVRPFSDGVAKVEVPPTVLVHRYYYTGNRSFQGPLLTGGPCIVVANHPKSGERAYVSVQMPPGAPRVSYDADAIEYDFGPQSVTVKFGHLKNTVHYAQQGTRLGERVHDAARTKIDNTKEFVRRTGLPDAVDRTKELTRNLAFRTADGVNAVGRATITPIRTLFGFVPGFNAVTETPDERALRDRDSEIRRGVRQQTETIYVPTNR